MFHYIYIHPLSHQKLSSLSYILHSCIDEYPRLILNLFSNMIYKVMSFQRYTISFNFCQFASLVKLKKNIQLNNVQIKVTNRYGV
jgi:hypothetical protein